MSEHSQSELQQARGDQHQQDETGVAQDGDVQDVGKSTDDSADLMVVASDYVNESERTEEGLEVVANEEAVGEPLEASAAEEMDEKKPAEDGEAEAERITGEEQKGVVELEANLDEGDKEVERETEADVGTTKPPATDAVEPLKSLTVNAAVRNDLSVHRTEEATSATTAFINSMVDVNGHAGDQTPAAEGVGTAHASMEKEESHLQLQAPGAHPADSMAGVEIPVSVAAAAAVHAAAVDPAAASLLDLGHHQPAAPLASPRPGIPYEPIAQYQPRHLQAQQPAYPPPYQYPQQQQQQYPQQQQQQYPQQQQYQLSHPQQQQHQQQQQQGRPPMNAFGMNSAAVGIVLPGVLTNPVGHGYSSHYQALPGQHASMMVANDPAAAGVLENLKLFLATAPSTWEPEQVIKRFPLPTGEHISCVLWNNLFHVTGTDIVRSLTFRFAAFGRPVRNLKKFEEGVFSDLRNLKPGIDATLEEPRSEFLEYLFKANCIRTQKKQKVFYWFSVPHDRLFMDALERDLKRETLGIEPTTTALQQLSLTETIELAKRQCLLSTPSNGPTAANTMPQTSVWNPEGQHDHVQQQQQLPTAIAQAPPQFRSPYPPSSVTNSPALSHSVVGSPAIQHNLLIPNNAPPPGASSQQGELSASNGMNPMFALFEGSPNYKQRRRTPSLLSQGGEAGGASVAGAGGA
ncbi:homeodomain transcription factor ste12, partial [Irineochytrium annulatum]